MEIQNIEGRIEAKALTLCPGGECQHQYQYLSASASCSRAQLSCLRFLRPGTRRDVASCAPSSENRQEAV